ncbi:hypothetical protein MHTCC0001_30530 [Flavobacteriaceae bacterium MHTCC 0001]
MKKHITLISILILLITTQVKGQTFKKIENHYATEVSVAPHGDVFVIGTSGNIFKFDTKTVKFKRYTPNSSASGYAVSYNNSGYYNKNKTSTPRLSGHDLVLSLLKSKIYNDVDITNNNSTWAFKNGRLFNALTFGSYNRPNINVLGATNSRISAFDKNKIFYIKNDNTIWHYDGKTSRKLTGKALDIAYDMKQRKLYIINTLKQIAVWNPRRKNWDIMGGTRRDFRRLSVNNGKIWATTTKNSIYTNDTKVIAKYGNNPNGVYKLKITLERISCKQAWDNDKKDDYLLKMTTGLRIGSRSYSLENKQYNRIGTVLKTFGAANSLYMMRSKNQKNFAAVQLHVNEGSFVSINNSGVFNIPTSTNLNTNISFNITAVIDEVSNKTERIITKIEKLNLKRIIEYLKDRKKSRIVKTESIPATRTSGGVLISGSRRYYYDMGAGYTTLELKTNTNGRPVIYGYISGSKKSTSWGGSKYTKPTVKYRMELVD